MGEQGHSIGKTIAKLRKEKGWTQAELAEKLQVSDKAVSKWEQENGSPSIEFFPAIADLFGVTIDFLMTGRSERSGAKSKPKKAKTPASPEDKAREAEEERILKSCVEGGLIRVKDLFAVKNIALIKKALAEYDIHPIELPCRLFLSKKWRELFEYAVDSGNRDLADAALKGDERAMEGALIEELVRSVGYGGYPAAFGTEFAVKGCPPFGKRWGQENYCVKRNYDLELDIPFIAEYFASYRKQAISEISFEEERERVLGELTEEYFLSELEAGNLEMVVIKLCVRMEALLRSRGYEGDFSEMLEKYCKDKGKALDEWGYETQAEFVGYLQKLRKCRNSIVHADKKKDLPTADEIGYCIDYICGLE